MSRSLSLLLLLVLAWPAAARDLSNHAGPKPAVDLPANIPLPGRQGGDTVASAVVIPALPFTDTGTTAGYADDYAEICPYTFSAAPDVVYSYRPPQNERITIDLCGSFYDTATWVYDSDLNLQACNDDYYPGPPCGEYVSLIADLPVLAGEVYYIIIDGYTTSYGDYVLTVTGTPACLLFPPPGSVPEGEPPLHDGYIDEYNGGCNTPPDHPFQVITGDAGGDLCLSGVSGWYLMQETGYRDTDWFELTAGPAGAIRITADAEQECYIFELAGDCANVSVVQSATAGECNQADLTIVRAQGEIVWFWVGPTTFSPPGDVPPTFNYIVWFGGLEPGVATTPTTWGALKALYE